MLDDAGYRRRAADVQRSTARHDAPAEAVRLLERLAEKQVPSPAS